ncbi:SMI1/KNR4 family protein [Paenibacillus mangrovi]|uniref:SMI1/KNR4 family protein n=1 Tax=Paenibacillus mangrovi TaxID=2931978 RepID=UPI003CC7CC26
MLNHLINGLDLNPPINMNLVIETESELGVKFPSDYKEFIVQCNGAEETVGNAYVQLWAIDELVGLNEGYAVKEFADGLVIFGYKRLFFLLLPAHARLSPPGAACRTLSLRR